MAWAETAKRVDELRMRARDAQVRFHALPRSTRWPIWIAVELIVAIVVYFVDRSLGVGLAVLFAILWMPRLEPRVRLALQVALVVIFTIAAFADESVRSVPVVLAIGFALSWLPWANRLRRDERVPPAARRWVLPPLARVGPAAALFAMAVFYPTYVDHLFTIPLFGAFPNVQTGVVMLVYIMMAVGLNVVVGYAGLLDLGYVAFYAMGAYTAAWFASLQFPQKTFHLGAVGVSPDAPGFHVSIWILLLLAGILTAVIGVIIGLPTLRLRGDYLAIVTLGFGEIMPQIARNGDSLFGTGFNLTNGPNGITPLDSPGFGNTISDATGGFLPSVYLTCCKSSFLGHQLAGADVFFWTGLVLVLFTVFCSWRLRDSRLGRAWIAIREDETAAAAMGVPLMRTKTWAYATGAFFGGIAGAYYASFKSATFPGDFFFNISVFILCMVILGGMGNIWGVVFGAAFLAYLDQAGLANTGGWLNTNLGLNIEVPKYEFGIFGVILLIVMLFRPEGLIPSSRRAAEFHEGVADEPLYDVVR
jgi:branched-chain amino acid transport system permease protein